MNRTYLVAALVVLAAMLAAWWASSQGPAPVKLVPTLTGKAEYCLSCHADLPEISPSHSIEAFGCVTCHGGQRLALEADLAHSTLRGGRNPSRLETAQESCGGVDCHSGEAVGERNHLERVMTSLQATYAGAIAQVRYQHGLQTDRQATYSLIPAQDLDGASRTSLLVLESLDLRGDGDPTMQRFGENCLDCHLGAEPLAGLEFSRLSGCAACHTPTAGTVLEPMQDAGSLHQLTTALPFTQCNTCHNRGHYDIQTISFAFRSDQPVERWQACYPPGTPFARCEWTLDCIDCHTRSEAMGDSDLYSSQAEIQYIQCRTCHGTQALLPHSRRLINPLDIAFRLAFLNPVVALKLGDTILVTETGEPLWNIQLLPDGSYQLMGKANGRMLYFHAVKGSGCLQEPDQQEARYCRSCHAFQPE